MLRFPFVVTVLGGVFSVSALGQQQPQSQPQSQPQATQPQAPPAIRLPSREHPGVPQGGSANNPNYADGAGGSMYSQGMAGGSMFQAQAGTATISNNGGGAGGIAAISVFAVPRPQPKLIKAH